MHPRALAMILPCVLLLGACGGGAAEQEPAATSPPRSAVPREQAPLAIPSKVPLRASSDGDPDAIEVIRRWTQALRRSDLERASALWAVPAKVQNGTPVLTLATREDIALFNGSLPCGSVLVSARGAKDGFTIAVVRLTKRPGADCGGGAGNEARTAILVREGRIAEWYRLPDDPDAPQPAPDVPQPEPEPDAPAQPDAPIV